MDMTRYEEEYWCPSLLLLVLESGN